MAQAVVSVYSRLLQEDMTSLIELGKRNPIPQFGHQIIEKVVHEFFEVARKECPVVYCDNNVTIVGDIHGNIHDLLRILKSNGLPPYSSYVFLGDYIDRGSFSIECITLLLALKVCYPNHITLLRGNHELREINERYGFKEEIITEFENEKLFNLFNDIFMYLPIIAIINNKYFCVHGGLSPLFKDISQIKSLKFPIKNVPQVVIDLLWSDPSEAIETFTKNQRGVGYLWGPDITKEFVSSMKYDVIIRGHQCCSNGIKTNHDGQIITVFSSSNYSADGNKSGYLIVDKDDKFIPHELEEISPATRAVSIFATYQCGKITQFNSYEVDIEKPMVITEKRNSLSSLQLLDSKQSHHHARIRIKLHLSPTQPVFKNHTLRTSSDQSVPLFD